MITNTPDKSKSRQELQREIRQKEAAVNYLARTYSNLVRARVRVRVRVRVSSPNPSPNPNPNQARTYSNRKLPPEELKQCLYSIADNNAYLYQAWLGFGFGFG